MQQTMAREMACVLREVRGSEPPEDQLPQVRQLPLPVIDGEHLILVNGGDADADEVMCVAERLGEDHGVDYVVPLVSQKDKAGYKPSDITKDLRENLTLCTAVLTLYCDGPKDQVHQ